MPVRLGPRKKQSVLKKDLSHVFHPLVQHATLKEKPPLVIVDGKNATVYDADGKAYLDAMAGLWCVNIGYGRTEVAEAAYKQMKQLSYYPHTQANVPAAELAEVLSRLLGPRLNHVYYVNSGSEANEAAFKIARQYAKLKYPGQTRHKIIGRYMAYHGTTLATLAAGGFGDRRAKFEPLDGSFVHAPPVGLLRDPFGLGDLEKAAAAAATYLDFMIQGEGPELICAMVIEPIISGVGVLVPPASYLQRVQEICRKFGILLICDEVINGFGRTGTLFGHQHFGLEPDIVCVAKGITSGYMPLAATVVADDVFQAFLGKPEEKRHVAQVNTWGGHAAACAASLKNLEILTGEGMVENSRDTGEYLKGVLRQVAARRPAIADVRGKGLLIGIELVADSSTLEPLSDKQITAIFEAVKNRGVFIGRSPASNPYSGTCLTISPPLCLTRGEADTIAAAVDGALGEVLGA